jgi:hypothetical protein
MLCREALALDRKAETAKKGDVLGVAAESLGDSGRPRKPATSFPL